MTDSPLERYRALCASGDLTRDRVQEDAMVHLDGLARALGRPPRLRDRLLACLPGRPAGPRHARGIWLHGGVGGGKSMMMDLFFEAAPIRSKRRVHFHAFMQLVHRTVHARRQSDRNGNGLIGAVAKTVAEDSKLLCFDEFEVTDIADAMILGRLFEQFFRTGIVIVATSNRHPRDLYAGGINRQLFLPFIAMLEERLDIVAVEAEQDYRRAFLAETGVYHVPADAHARQALDEAFGHLVGNADIEPAEIEVRGRILEVARQARHVARFSFAELCGRPLGSADYLALAEAFHTIVIDGIPILDRERRNETRRFVNLIDILYENRVGLLCSAEAPPDRLHPETDGLFEFRRTASRLVEMQSAEYLDHRHAGRNPATDSGAGS